MKHISKFCATGNDIVNPVDIVRALRYNGGVGNYIVEMVCINQRNINAFTKKNLQSLRGYHLSETILRFGTIILPIMFKFCATMILVME